MDGSHARFVHWRSRFNSGPWPQVQFLLTLTARRPRTTIPAALEAALDVLELLFGRFFDLLVALIFPATPTAVSSLAAFGLIFPIVGIVLGLLYRLVRSAG